MRFIITQVQEEEFGAFKGQYEVEAESYILSGKYAEKQATIIFHTTTLLAVDSKIEVNITW